MNESEFNRDVSTNCHILHFWASRGDENPKKNEKASSQRRFSVNVLDGCYSWPAD